MEKDKLITGHEYDGIQELDNPLPGWWLITFYGTIVFAIGYFAYYQFLSGPTSEDNLRESMAIIQANKDNAQANKPKIAEVNVAALLDNPEALAKGKMHFETKCSACHGMLGEGSIGPNLIDNYWIHGDGSVEKMLPTITEGILDKGMPPWKGVIPDNEVPAVAAYILSLKGTNPPNQKAAQGELIE